MSFFFFFKILGDLSFFFFAASSLFCGTDLYLHFFPLFLFSFVGAAAMELDEKHQNRRFLPFLLLPLGFIGAKSWITVLILSIACLYIICGVSLKKFYLNYNKQLKFLVTCGTISFFLTLIVWIFDRADYFSHIIPLAIIFVISNVILTQGLRHNFSVWNQKKYKQSVLICSGTVILISILFSSHAFLALLKMLIKGIYLFIIRPIIYIFMIIIGGIFTLILKLTPPEFLEQLSKRVNMLDKSFFQPMNEALKNLIGTPYDVSNPEHLKATVIVFFIIAILTMTILLIKRLKNSSSRFHKNVGKQRRSVAVGEVDSESEKAPHDLIPPKDPREAVRFYYRKFLRNCIHLGMVIPDSANSQHIEKLALQTLPPESRPLITSLRQQYIKARYSPHPIEKEDVKITKEVVNLLEKQGYTPLHAEKQAEEFERLQTQITDVGNPML